MSIMSLDNRRVVWEPLPKQRLAMACPVDEMFWGGVKGGGKTDLMVMRPAPVLQLAQKKFERTGQRQRCAMVIFRKTLSNESRDMIDRSKILYPMLDPQMGIRGWHEQAKRWDFTSGATVTFAHLDGPDDYKRWNGIELVGIGIDQAEECLPYDVFKFLAANNRTTDPDYAAKKWLLLTGNPGGPYADWLHRYFIKPHPQGGEFIDRKIKVKGGTKTITRTRIFIESLLEDNPYYYNDGAYEANLRDLPLHMQRWYLHGDWGASADGYYAGLLKPDIHFIDSFDIPRSWQMGMGIDWGETSPACVEVGARDEDNRIYFVDELYCPGQTGTILGGKMLEMFARQEWSRAKKWRPDEVPGYIDPSAHRVHSKGDSMNISDAIESCGFSTFPANNDRIPGWRHIAERMNPQKNKDGTFGKPRVFVFKDRCPRLCEQLSRAVPDPQRPGDINTRIEDHALDAARYLAQEWPLDLYASYEDDDEDLRAWAQVAAWKSRVSGNIPSTGYGD